MVTASRIVSDTLRLGLRRLDLAAVLRAAVETVRPSATAKGVRLAVDIDDVGIGLVGDPDRIQQIVWNLLSNAVKFTTKDGVVSVRSFGDRAAASVHVEVRRAVAPSEDADRPARTDRPETSPLRGVHVLVVDDQSDAREIVAAVLQGAGARLTPASSAAEALTVLARPEDRERALLAGFHEHLAKPLEPTLLVQAVVRLLGRP